LLIKALRETHFRIKTPRDLHKKCTNPSRVHCYFATLRKSTYKKITLFIFCLYAINTLGQKKSYSDLIFP
jgi:hypothetical protein